VLLRPHRPTDNDGELADRASARSHPRLSFSQNIH
jgi:hypothetical protein